MVRLLGERERLVMVTEAAAWLLEELEASEIVQPSGCLPGPHHKAAAVLREALVHAKILLSVKP